MLFSIFPLHIHNEPHTPAAPPRHTASLVVLLSFLRSVASVTRQNAPYVRDFRESRAGDFARDTHGVPTPAKSNPRETRHVGISRVAADFAFLETRGVASGHHRCQRRRGEHQNYQRRRWYDRQRNLQKRRVPQRFLSRCFGAVVEGRAARFGVPSRRGRYPGGASTNTAGFQFPDRDLRGRVFLVHGEAVRHFTRGGGDDEWIYGPSRFVTKPDLPRRRRRRDWAPRSRAGTYRGFPKS